jgi:hypothetical protein
LSEAFGFRFVPERLRDRSLASGENDQRRITIEKELRASFRNSLIVTAKHQDGICLRDLVVHQVIIPEGCRQRVSLMVHNS